MGGACYSGPVKTLRLYNTETRCKEPLLPADGKRLKIYTCGPTVYNFAHIGNFRTYLFEDLLRRSCLYIGMKVEQVMNLTDVDDKTIKGACEKGVSLGAFTQPYIDSFFEDLKTLRIQPAEHYPRATDYIPQMVEMIQKLLKKGYAYPGQDGSIYYAISKFPSYGRLSHLEIESLEVGYSDRVVRDEYEKERACDFVLWKAYDPTRDGEIFWESALGKGRPGWHIECSAMATALLGDTLDLHVGGVDNIFPHHENEIAQSEACTGCTFARHWTHSEHLLVQNRKMSKSLGNFYTLRDLLALGYTGREVRFALIQGHYRSQMNFTLEGLAAARSALERLDSFITRLEESGAADSEQAAAIARAMLDSFEEALIDDLNLPVAFATLFDLIREGNSLIDSGHGAHSLKKALLKMDQLLAIFPEALPEDGVPADLLALLETRQQARASKNWAEADRCRYEIETRGYIIEDTPKGPRLKKGAIK